jgi:hypothetical protein
MRDEIIGNSESSINPQKMTACTSAGNASRTSSQEWHDEPKENLR